MFVKQAEPYRVIHATDAIYKACSKEASYRIDPVAIKADTIPKTEDGEHIGVGGGIWHDGMASGAPLPISTSQ